MSEKGPELLYALGKNPAESARIAALPPLQAAIELGKLETTLSQPARKTQTSAPEPVAPITGGSGSQTLDPERMTADEWRLWREKQIGN